MENIIVDNKEVIMKKKTEAVNCYDIKSDCALSNHYQITNITYNAKMISNL